jgi:hypothetical protein
MTYLTKSEFARRLGVCTKTVEKYYQPAAEAISGKQTVHLYLMPEDAYQAWQHELK